MGCGASRGSTTERDKWDILDERIPYQPNNHDVMSRRVHLWNKMDRRKANSLTEEDCLTGCEKDLQLYQLCGKENTRVANKAAWEASHLLRTLPDNTVNVDPMEFRIYLQYLREYLELAYYFEEFDTNGNRSRDGGRYLTLEEFIKVQPNMMSWMREPNVDAPEKTFKEINRSNTGKMTFNEFCYWAERNNLDPAALERRNAQEKEQEAKERSARMLLFTQLSNRLPQGRTPDDYKRRELLFDKFDKNKQGKLTEQDCLDGCKDHLELHKLSKKNDLITINKGAFNNAKNVLHSNNPRDANTIDRDEFRFYLISLRNHYRFNAMFDQVDSSDDKQISREEFKRSIPKLQQYGADIKPEDADRTFDEIDTKKKGKIDYYQFATWANQRDLDIEKADLEADEGYRARQLAFQSPPPMPQSVQAEEVRTATPKDERSVRMLLFTQLSNRMPQGHTPEDYKRRELLFDQFDHKRQGRLTEQDCLDGCKDHLELNKLSKESDLITINKGAFNNAKSVMSGSTNADANTVDRDEFRFYLISLRNHYKFNSMFDQVDSSDDKQISREEFKEAIPKLQQYGADIKPEEADQVFDEIDTEKKGKIDYYQFATWANQRDLVTEKADLEADEGFRARQLAFSPPPMPQSVQAEEPHEEVTKEHFEHLIILGGLSNKLPQGKEKNEDRKRRELLFVDFDKKKNGRLTEQDCLDACKDHLELNKLSKESDLIIINKGAFNNAKSVTNADPNADTISQDEFRFYLISLRNHYRFYAMFEEPDTSEDKQITREEFKEVIPKLQQYGADIKPEEADQVFDEIDADKKGKIDYYQFATWANSRDLIAERDDWEAEKQQAEALRKAEEEARAKARAESQARTKLWGQLRSRLPLDRTKMEAAKRDRLFNTFDQNKSGGLSEAECLKGTKEHLQLDQLANEDDLGSINHRAFTVAKGLRPVEERGNPDVVDRYEFRAYLSTLRNTFEINEMFNELDKSGDRRISRTEFKLLLPRLANWGVRVNDADRAFDEIDTKRNGYIDFYEFCDFADKYNLDMEREDYQKLLDARRAAEADAQRAEMTAEEKEAARVEANRRRVLWDDLKLRLPRLKTKAQNEQRSELFKQFDTDGTGHLYYEHFEAGARNILKLHEFVEPLAPILTRAFDHAANVNREEGDNGVPAVERIEFRIALVFIYDFLELFIKFEELEFSMERRISFPMFQKLCPMLESWGIPLPDQAQAFEEVDEFGVGTVTFDEFADWAIFRHMQAQNVHVARRRSSTTSDK